MLDKKSIAILKSLNKLSEGCTYKVVTSDEIIQNLSQKNLYDYDNIKEIVEFLEKQEYINIKFSEENTYCYSLLPKARIFLEHNITSKQKKLKLAPSCYLIVLLMSFIGSLLALFVFLYYF